MTLNKKHCIPCEGGVSPLTKDAATELLKQLNDWSFNDTVISKTFSFKNFYHTMAFVNAVAFIANQENHHPDMEVGYNRCTIHFTTHAIKGLSENDFICAAKIDAL